MKSITISAPDDLFDQAIAALCANYGYTATIPNPDNILQQIPNPITAEDFAKNRLLYFMRENMEAAVIKQASVAVETARAQAEAQLNAVSSLVVAVIS
jgi:hypothetical protein